MLPPPRLDELRDQVAEVKVGLELRMRPERCAVLVAQENRAQATCELLGDLEDREKFSGARRALDLEVIAVVMVKALQRFDDQEFTGIQIGPRQLELPPNRVVSADSAYKRPYVCG